MESLQSKDLRIGNYVSGDINKLIVVNIDNLNVHVTLKEKLFHPIPLTEEWLVKLGFDFNNNDYFLSKKGFDICFEKQGCLLKCFLDSIEIDIKHVHKLQNLYFALTGQELTIKHN